MAAETVKNMFALYLQGYSLQKIADNLNEGGITTARANQWSKQAVKVVLSNQFYIGVVQFDDIKKAGSHTALISKSIFQKVQTTLQENRKRI